MIYAAPGSAGAKVQFKAKYDNFIGGKWLAPVKGEYFDVISPINGKPYTRAARSGAGDIELALDAAHAAADKWGKTAPADRANVLLKIADRIEANLELLAYAETVDNGKPIRESRNADLPLVIDCFRYYAGWADKIHGQTIPIRGRHFCYTRREPVGVAGQIIPWNFPLLMAAWKWGPALAAGCTVILKPAEQTPLSALRLGELAMEAGFPAGVINIVPSTDDHHTPYTHILYTLVTYQAKATKPPKPTTNQYNICTLLYACHCI